MGSCFSFEKIEIQLRLTDEDADLKKKLSGMTLVFFEHLFFLFVSCRIPITTITTEEGIKTSVMIPIVTIVLMVLLGVIIGLIFCKKIKKKKGNDLFFSG